MLRLGSEIYSIYVCKCYPEAKKPFASVATANPNLQLKLYQANTKHMYRG